MRCSLREAVCVFSDARPRRRLWFISRKKQWLSARCVVYVCSLPATNNLRSYPVSKTQLCCGQGLELQVHSQTDRQADGGCPTAVVINTPPLYNTWYGLICTAIQGCLKRGGGQRGTEGSAGVPQGKHERGVSHGKARS